MRYLPLILLTGCALSPIDYGNPPPADWPRLEERISYVSQEEMKRQCGNPPSYARGCSNISFKYRVCWIYLTDKDPELLAHEREHCRGYDHVGDTNRSRNAWEKWKRENRK